MFEFLLTFHNNYMALSCIISAIKRDIGRKSKFFIPHLYLMPPLRCPIGILPQRLVQQARMIYQSEREKV